MYYKKILIITVNAINENSNNGKTFSNFFRNYPSDKIAQLYFHRDSPNTTITSNFYRISDEDIVSNFFRSTNNFGTISSNNKTGEVFFSPKLTSKIRKSYFFKILRSILFLRVSLIEGSVFKWIKKFNPEVIFFCGGDANFLYKKVKDLSCKLRIPVIQYTTDDYTIIKPTLNIFYLINRIWTRSEYISFSKLKHIYNYTISSYMSLFYNEQYSINSKTLMNLVNLNDFSITQHINIRNMVYIGRFHSNRWVSLIALAEVIFHNKLDFFIDIYSNYPLENQLHLKIQKYGFISFKGAIKGSDVVETLKSYDILLHLEAFDKNSINVTYLSISTKIPEYLVSNRLIIAIGPPQIASIRYLYDNEIAITITKLNDIKSSLSKISIQQYMKFQKKTLDVLKLNHDQDLITSNFYNEISEAKYE